MFENADVGMSKELDLLWKSMHCVINQLLRKYKASTAVVFSRYLTFSMEMTGKTKELGWPTAA